VKLYCEMKDIGVNPAPEVSRATRECQTTTFPPNGWPNTVKVLSKSRVWAKSKNISWFVKFAGNDWNGSTTTGD
jgi:hypothetical protein